MQISPMFGDPHWHQSMNGSMEPQEPVKMLTCCITSTIITFELIDQVVKSLPVVSTLHRILTSSLVKSRYWMKPSSSIKWATSRKLSDDPNDQSPKAIPNVPLSWFSRATKESNCLLVPNQTVNISSMNLLKNVGTCPVHHLQRIARIIVFKIFRGEPPPPLKKLRYQIGVVSKLKVQPRFGSCLTLSQSYTTSITQMLCQFPILDWFSITDVTLNFKSFWTSPSAFLRKGSVNIGSLRKTVPPLSSQESRKGSVNIGSLRSDLESYSGYDLESKSIIIKKLSRLTLSN